MARSEIRSSNVLSRIYKKVQERRQLITTVVLPVLYILPLKSEAIRDEQNYFQSWKNKISVSFADILFHIFPLLGDDCWE